MPELPEVETVRRQMEQVMVGEVVAGITVRKEKIFEGERADLVGQEIVSIKRVGKYLIVYMASGRGVLIHLKMTGRIVIRQPEKSDNQSVGGLSETGDPEVNYSESPHTRVIVELRSGRKLYYWDTRMFGYLKMLESAEKMHKELTAKLGPEPWDISDRDFLRKLQKTGRAVKEAILDQSLLAGVGNIYANDGLWLAGINPKRPANSLRISEVEKLRKSLCEVLERGLAVGGASDNTYRDFFGGRGGYQNEFLVYGRTGEPCNRCGTPLVRVVVGRRGSWVCPECQN